MKVLVDGRVFSSGAYNRGMGRYVEHVINLLRDCGSEVCLLLFKDCYLTREDNAVKDCKVRYADYACEYLGPTSKDRQETAHAFTFFLSRLIELDQIELYIDATPFIAPMRYDLAGCAVCTICYDFIPLKYPKDYIVSETGIDVYYNGLARLLKADHTIAISETVAGECQKYLGIETAKLSVVAPRIDSAYENWAATDAHQNGKPYIFGMVGGHKSKNSKTSMKIYRQISKLGFIDVKLNAPTEDQLQTLLSSESFEGMNVTHSVTEQEKISAQSGAAVITHLSLEEGFGIPLLEAIFLYRKVIVLDIPMNREILGIPSNSDKGSVLWLNAFDSAIDIEVLKEFIATSLDHKYYDGIKHRYRSHWAASAVTVSNATRSANSHSQRWLKNVCFKIFSSIPGDFCGVADYSLCYVRSTLDNVAFFFSGGDQKHISYVPNLRLLTGNDYPGFQTNNPDIKGLFNLAFSESLYLGVKLLVSNGKAGDAVLVHERAYIPGLWHFKKLEETLDDLVLDLIRHTAVEASENAKNLAFSSLVNSRRTAEKGTVALPSSWLKDLPVRLISHLSDAVLEKMELAKDPNALLQNDLVGIEDKLDFVPLGIDRRGSPMVYRAAAALRRRRGIQPDDVVIGHFGLILDDIKKLRAISQAVCNLVSDKKMANARGRRLFFLMSGRIVDHKLFDEIRRLFTHANISSRLIHSNPAEERDFDAEIAMCDAVVCFRKQTRGQLSHIFVRALSIGRPVIVNEDSGYAYDDRTLVRDNFIQQDLSKVIDLLLDPETKDDLSSSSYAYYLNNHCGSESLAMIIQKD